MFKRFFLKTSKLFMGIFVVLLALTFGLTSITPRHQVYAQVEESPTTVVEITSEPTAEPTLTPTVEPTLAPTIEPTLAPTVEPTLAPTVEPTLAPTIEPSLAPTTEPALTPTTEPTLAPTTEPTATVVKTATAKPTPSKTPIFVKPTVTTDEGNGVVKNNNANIKSAAITTKALQKYYTWKINGGYVAAGVGMRNKGYGNIILNGIPSGAKIMNAFLYWNILSPDNTTANTVGKINGNSITGTMIDIGVSPCWDSSYKSRTYRADVTSYVTGNKTYALTGFASGLTNGSDPIKYKTPPLLEGASLVVVYYLNTYPRVQIFLYNGAATVNTTMTSKTNIGPFPAYSSYQAYTTFIVADGQSSTEAVTFNGKNVAAADLDGTDGYYWDNETNSDADTAKPGISVGSLISSNSTTATINISVPTSTGTSDCLVHVAQILSVSNGADDTDGDGLPNAWEANGYDYNGDGTVDVDLPAVSANPFHKDLYLEMDYMSSNGDNHHRPSIDVVNTMMNTFRNSGVTNPDKQTGIDLHIDRSNAIAHRTEFVDNCNDIFTRLEAIKKANMAAARYPIYHYQLWVHDLCPDLGSTSGIAQSIPGDDSLISLGSWPNQGTTAVRTGTSLHEFGHTLNLRHGFPTGVTAQGDGGANDAYTPNHLSVMSYLYQSSGLIHNGSTGTFDYQRWDLNQLNESCLNETKGVSSSSVLDTYGLRWYRWNGSSYYAMQDLKAGSANGPVDWNGDGKKTSTCVSVSINDDTDKEILQATKNEWIRLVYNGGAVGTGKEYGLDENGNKIPVYAIDPLKYHELTFDEEKAIEASLQTVK
jgi:hypothetical protein